MKWFKHSCTARDDQKLSKLMDELGLEGYGCYMIILEVVGHEMGSSNDCYAEFSLKKWGSFAQLSAKKFAKFAQVMAKLSLFYANISEKNCKIEIPKLLEYRDNHTKNLQATNKKVSLDKEKDKEKELDKEIKSIPKSKPVSKLRSSKYTADAERFWLETKYARRDEDDKAGVLKKYQSLRKKYSHEDLILSVSRRSEYMASWTRKWGLRRMLEPLNVEQALEGDLVKNNTSATSGNSTVDAANNLIQRINNGEQLFEA